jgi:hypothetical protein
MMSTMDRRKHERTLTSSRHALERALGSWQRLLTSWQAILQVAEAAQNWERMALAEAKLDECQHELARLETLLHQAAPG